MRKTWDHGARKKLSFMYVICMLYIYKLYVRMYLSCPSRKCKYSHVPVLLCKDNYIHINNSNLLQRFRGLLAQGFRFTDDKTKVRAVKVLDDSHTFRKGRAERLAFRSPLSPTTNTPPGKKGRAGQQAVFNTAATRAGLLHFLLHPFIPSATA